MKLTSIELHPGGSSDVCELSFRDPTRQNPYNVRSIAGLDPGDITSKFYGVSLDSLTNFYNMSLVDKDVVFRISLKPEFSDNETYSDLRERLYKMISASRTGIVTVQFLNDGEVQASISGFIKKIETTLFDPNPDVLLTINPSDPMLVGPTRITVAGPGAGNLLITDDLSTAPHGYQFEVSFSSTKDHVRFDDPLHTTQMFFEVTPDGGFVSGDHLFISSEVNNKYVYYTRAAYGSTKFYIADKITPGSLWPLLFPGDNGLRNTFGSVAWVGASYLPAYWGV